MSSCILINPLIFLSVECITYILSNLNSISIAFCQGQSAHHGTTRDRGSLLCWIRLEWSAHPWHGPQRFFILSHCPYHVLSLLFLSCYLVKLMTSCTDIDTLLFSSTPPSTAPHDPYPPCTLLFRISPTPLLHQMYLCPSPPNQYPHLYPSLILISTLILILISR